MPDNDTLAVTVAYAEFAGRIHAIANLVTDLNDAERLARIRVALDQLNEKIGRNAGADR